MRYEKSRRENNNLDNLQRELEEKEKRYKENQEKEKKKQKEKYDFLNKQKEEKEKIKKQFEELTSKNKGEIDIEKIKKLFPDDEELHEKLEKTKNEFEKRQSQKIEAYERDKLQRREIIRMKSESSSKLRSKKSENMERIENSSKKGNKDINKKTKNKKRPKTGKKLRKKIDINNQEDDNKYNILNVPKIEDKAILDEDKIKSLVNDYQSKLMKSFLIFCNKEKEAQNERKEIFAEAKTEKEKKRLQNILKMQNAQSADKIGEYNKIIDERIEEYRAALMESLKNQKNNKNK